MKRKNIHATSLTCFIIFLILFLCSHSVIACTGFTAKKDETVLVGHNKDWWSSDTWIHTYPQDDECYARLLIEIPYPHIFNSDYHVLAGGINEHGLCFESFVTPFNLASYSFFKPPLFKNPVDHFMKYFTTVEEVIEYIENHNLFFLNYILCSGQIFVVDRTGDAAIIEGDDIIRINRDYMICTNFLHSQPSLGGYPCWRYQTAQEELENMTNLSIPFFTSLLNKTHQHYYTQYSWIFNVTSNILYLYHYYDYDHGIMINLTEEFLEGAHSYYLPSLFEPENNSPPYKPDKPIGPTTIKRGIEYTYETNTSDPDNIPTELYYQWDFGDGTQTYWLLNRPPYWGMVVHTYEKTGTYQIRVKAKDLYGRESPWSDSHQIHVTKSIKDHIFTLFI